MTTHQARLLWGAYVVFACCLASGWNVKACRAADDSQAFVEGLCERHFFDTASDYLRSQAANPALAANLKAAIAYQQAVVFIAGADQAADAQSRDADRRRACAKLQEFLSANPDHDLSVSARDRLGNLLLALAESSLAQSEQPGARKAALRRQAQADDAAARTAFEELAQQLRGQLDKLPQGDEREELGAQWLGASVNAGRATFFTALATEPGSNEQKNLLVDAAARCGSLYQKYPKRLGGGVAHFYEGRANEELGEQKLALAAYCDLIDGLSDSDATVRLLKTQAVLRAQRLWLQDQNYDALVDKTLSWAKSAHGSELQDPDWLAVKLSAATALQKLAAALPKNDPKAVGYAHDARGLITEVIDSKNSNLQSAAQDLLAQLSGNHEANPSPRQSLSRQASSRTSAGSTSHEALQLAADTKAPATADSAATDSDAEITSFDAAYDKATDATEEVKSTQVELDFAHQEAQPDAKHIAELEATLKTQRDEAFKLCQLAISLANAATNIEKVNQVRYWLCWFHYAKENYYDAAVLGEFLARKYPNSASALPGAQVALASLDALYRQRKQAGNDNLTFETNHLFDLANYVIGRWPDDSEAATALEMLVSIAIDAGDYDKAKAIIGRAPDGSAARFSGEANLGQALWVKYLRGMQQRREQKAAAATTATATSPTDDPQANRNLDALLQQAQQELEFGVGGLRKLEVVDERAILPALSLAQLYLNAGDANKAATILEDPKIGPLTLLKQKHPATQPENIAAEIYKTALLAYVATTPQQLDNAVASMDALEALYVHDPDGPARSMQTLVDIAFNLEQKLDDLNSRGETEKADATIKAFEKLLSKISQRQDAADYRTLNWIAATYETLANGATPGNPTDSNGLPGTEKAPAQPVKYSPDAQNNLQQAVKAYEAILAKSKDHAEFMPAEKLPAIQRRLALDYRGLGNYEKSIALFADVLKDKPSILPVQMEAAYTYQWGGKSNPDFYVAAILGGRGPSESVWGWNKISQKTARDERFRDAFDEARYNMALCRVEFAATRTSPDEKRKLLELAKGTIRETQRYESTLGGLKWKPQYEKLLREIQKNLDEPVVGLLEFEPKETDAPAPNQKN
ncbi:MAG TPA: hypothetical protein VMJ32_13700 [Pirellulales bacterium]|nr:hypothetical protein [Pirellulales bacterium]